MIREEPIVAADDVFCRTAWNCGGKPREIEKLMSAHIEPSRVSIENELFTFRGDGEELNESVRGRDRCGQARQGEWWIPRRQKHGAWKSAICRGELTNERRSPDPLITW